MRNNVERNIPQQQTMEELQELRDCGLRGNGVVGE